MRLVPIQCPECTRAALATADAAAGVIGPCFACGRPVRVLQGQSYGLSDASLFKDLEMTLHEARVSPDNAAWLRAEMTRVSGSGRGLRRLLQLLPALAVVELIVGEEAFMLRKAEAMLAVLLDAIATSRSQSGFIAAVTPEAPSRSGRER